MITTAKSKSCTLEYNMNINYKVGMLICHVMHHTTLELHAETGRVELVHTRHNGINCLIVLQAKQHDSHKENSEGKHLLVHCS